MKIFKILIYALTFLIISCKNLKSDQVTSINSSLNLDSRLDTIVNKKNLYLGFYKSTNYIKDTTAIINSKPIKGELYSIAIDFLAKQEPLKVFFFQLNQKTAICIDDEVQGKINFTQIYYPNKPFTIKDRIYQSGNKKLTISITASLQKSTLLISKHRNSNKNENYGLGIQFINRYGNLTIDEKEYIISVNDYFINRISKNGKYLISIIESGTLKQNNKITTDHIQYSLGDTLFLGNNFYILDSIINNSNKIYLTKLSIDKKKRTGLELGNYLPEYSFESLIDPNFIIKIGGENPKFTLIDFWGTWCQPCLESIELLKELENKHSNKIRIISIASDFNKQDVSRYIKGHNMTWDHVFENYSSKEISSKFKIVAFPTLILIDKSGKILFRGTGKEGLGKAQNIIENL
jgi:thiol-disulfide isomerase/thioredoxin